MKIHLYVLNRLVQAVPIIIGIAILNFILINLAPGDAVEILAGEAGAANPEYMEDLRAKYGLDQPLYVQLVYYLKNLLQLDLGFSFRHNTDVSALVLERMPATMILMGATIALSFILGTILGVVAAKNVFKLKDRLISVFILVAYSIPLFWLGLMLIVLFSVKLGWLPSSGMESITANHEGIERAIDITMHLILPTVTLSLFYVAVYTRLMRASMLEVYNQDYVRAARARGLSENVIAFKHVLRNAMLPMVTMVGMQLGSLLGGSLIIETVFAWPGLGRLAFDAITQRDFNLLMGILLFSSIFVVVLNILLDVVYTFLDPRIEIR